MPNIRPLTLISQTSSLTTLQHPENLELVLVTTDTEGVPTAVEIASTSLELISTIGGSRRFIATVGAVFWQVEILGAGETITAMALTRAV